MWNIDTGKVIAKWTGHTGSVVCVLETGVEMFSRVLSGSDSERPSSDQWKREWKFSMHW